jgi:hypothetical protein
MFKANRRSTSDDSKHARFSPFDWMVMNFGLELSRDFVLQLDAFELLDTILDKDDIVVED